MIQRLRRLGTDWVYYVWTAVPIGLTLLLHTVHMFLVPLLIGLSDAELHASHSVAGMDMGSGMDMPMNHQNGGTLFTLAVFLLNLAGIIYGCWLLWRSLKNPAKGWHALMRPLISGGSVAVGVFMFVWMS
ncbi:hypothetical protein ACFPYJ_24470 [Paenibacillus solisilvae]|uniref:Uncharacterized protein n=1 Tax=Paenibacillus solisilvae TaxID=2486751 RepID=A0ABW0W223_9BACL